ncbi:MAG: SulP family inorganic anion transporter [Rhodobacterales bacterium]|nr:SulP family inorganic anion transporter [Rhodobacterales bacterium]
MRGSGTGGLPKRSEGTENCADAGGIPETNLLRKSHQKRRSNFNKDLMGVGVASMISGVLGGLPVVTVIARSSVNVNHGAKSRLSGLFNAILVILMVLFLSQFLNLLAHNIVTIL